MIHLDTTFLVDLLRESTREFTGPAHKMLDRLEDEELWLSVHVACELMAGLELASDSERERSKIETLFDSLQIAYPDERFAPTFGGLLAWIRRRGDTIATMDLLIATAAVVDSAPIVTRNAKHFSRVPGLKVLEY